MIEEPRNGSSGKENEDNANAQDEGAETVRSVDGRELVCSGNQTPREDTCNPCGEVKAEERTCVAENLVDTTYRN